MKQQQEQKRMALPNKDRLELSPLVTGECCSLCLAKKKTGWSVGDDQLTYGVNFKASAAQQKGSLSAITASVKPTEY